MTDQATALELLGVDQEGSTVEDQQVDNLTPERVLQIKEQVEADLLNPCVGCMHEFNQDPVFLDFCHHDCKEEVNVLGVQDLIA